MSLRTRLVLGALCALALALVTADLLVYRAMRQQLVERLDLSLRDARLPFGPARDGRGGKENGSTVDGQRGDDSVFVRIRSAAGGLERSAPATLADGTTASPRLPLVIDTPVLTDDPDGAAAFFEAPSVEAGGPRFRVKASRFANGDELVVAAPLTDVTDTLRRLRVAEAGVSLAALVAGGSIALVLVTLALRPLRRVEAAAGAVADGDLARRAALPPGRSEVAQLGATFDTMVDRLTDALDKRAQTEERLRRFVADGAHELRTPIAAVSAYAELIERGASERPADLARAVRGIRAESARLGVLVEDLLVLARHDAATSRTEPLEVVSIVADAAAAAQAIDPAWPVSIVAAEPVDTVGDADGLRRALDNLLGNVRTHTPAGTRTTVSVTRRADTGRVRIVVADDGPGIDSDGREHAFERFWRADTSRTRVSGGAGLGLAIVAAIVEGQGGTASIDDTVATGTTIVLDLPVRDGDS